MTAITKGTPAYIIDQWNRRATVCVRRVVIESMGKKQGTASYEEGGRFLKCQLYPEHIGLRIFAVADVPDVQAFALEMARRFKAENIEHYRNRQHLLAEDATKGFHEYLRRECELVMAEEPNVIYL